MDTFIKLRQCVQKFIKSYYFKNETLFLNNALSLKDLISESDMIIRIIINDDKYKDKPLEELKKIVYTAVKWKLGNLAKDSFNYGRLIQHLTKFYECTNREYNIVDSSENADEQRLYNLSTIKNDFEYPEILLDDLKKQGICSNEEYKMIRKKFWEGKTYSVIGKEHNLTKGRISQKFKGCFNRVKKRLNYFRG